jgi:hypothetical protein
MTVPRTLAAAVDLNRPMLSDPARRPACVGQSVAFDPVYHRGPIQVERFTDSARQLCASCPLLRECGAYADEHREEGLWGGTYRRTIRGVYHAVDLLAAKPATTESKVS